MDMLTWRLVTIIIEPRHEKTRFLHMGKQKKDADQQRSNNCAADQRICF